MNTLRYKTEYSGQVISFLKEMPVNVHMSSDIFLEIGKQFEGEPDAGQLSKLLKKTYTVMALEDDKLVGLAGMDKEGYIGIFATSDDKAQRLLLNALDRRAEKTEIAQLFVQPFEDSREIFKNHGYEPMNEGDDFNLIKKSALKEKLDLKPESVKSYTINPAKSIIVEGKNSAFPFFFLGMNLFFMFLLITLSVTKYKNAFAENDTNYLVVFIAFTSLFIVALTIFIWYFVRQAKLKKQVLSMRVTNGKIISYATLRTLDHEQGHLAAQTSRPAYTHVFITYVYYDENMVKHEAKYDHRYRFSGPYFYEGQELVVAYSKDKSYILNKYTLINPEVEEEGAIEEVSNAPELISAKKLSAYVPVKATKLYYGYATAYFCGLLIMLAIFLVIGIVAAGYTGRSVFYEVLDKLLFGLPFFAILGGFGLYVISIIVIEKTKYKKILESSGVRCTQGKIVHGDKTFKNNNKMRFYCKFHDGKEKRSVLVPYRSASNLVKSGKTSVLVVFTSTKAVVLVKKGVYPDKFVFGYYRN